METVDQSVDEIRGKLDGLQWNSSTLTALAKAFTWYAGDLAAAKLIAGQVWMEEDPEEDGAEPILLSDWAESVGKRPCPVVDGLIDANSCILLAGRPKGGKTFIGMEIAWCVATGEPLLGRWEVTRPGPVVYFSMEDSPFQFRDRWAQRGSIASRPNIFIRRGRRNLGSDASMEWLRRQVDMIEPSLIIIDTARQAFDVMNWNDAAEVSRVMRPIVDCANTLPGGASIIVITHTNKGGYDEAGASISGSNALSSAVDGYMVVEGTKRTLMGDLEGVIRCEGRINMPAKFGWVMDTDTLRVTALSSDEEMDRVRARRAEAAAVAAEKLASVIDAMGGYATLETLADTLNITHKAARDRARAAIKLGVLEEGGGAGTQNPTYIRPSVVINPDLNPGAWE